MFETIVDAMLIRARPCSVRDLEGQEQGIDDLTALLRVVSEDRVQGPEPLSLSMVHSVEARETLS